MRSQNSLCTTTIFVTCWYPAVAHWRRGFTMMMELILFHHSRWQVWIYNPMRSFRKQNTLHLFRVVSATSQWVCLNVQQNPGDYQKSSHYKKLKKKNMFTLDYVTDYFVFSFLTSNIKHIHTRYAHWISWKKVNVNVMIT